MYTEILWNCVTTKDSTWSYQNEMRILARNFLKNPQLAIVNPQRPRVELHQPRLKSSVVEVMVGPKADAAAVKRVRDDLAARGLKHVTVTQAKAAARQSETLVQRQSAVHLMVEELRTALRPSSPQPPEAVA
jgi:hypothetical protein